MIPEVVVVDKSYLITENDENLNLLENRLNNLRKNQNSLHGENKYNFESLFSEIQQFIESYPKFNQVNLKYERAEKYKRDLDNFDKRLNRFLNETTSTEIESIKANANNTKEEVSVKLDDVQIGIVNMMKVLERIEMSKSSVNSNISSNEEVIDWNEIKLDPNVGEEYVIGSGSFGMVIRAIWERVGKVKREVAIKVLKREPGEKEESYKNKVQNAKDELVIMKYADSQIGSDFIVKAYGLADGILSEELQDKFDTRKKIVGIIMSFVQFGSLNDYLHGRNNSVAAMLRVEEKINIITLVSQGLAELHSVGIVHGDIKPDNILIDSLIPLSLKFADFGLSKILEKTIGNNIISTLHKTKHIQGTLSYCAPEMLFNPSTESQTEVAKPSRKTDIFAFGILSWEVLTQNRPFSDVNNEIELSDLLHQGGRPSLDKLPNNTPADMIELLKKAWHQDRSKRISALEAYSKCEFLSKSFSNDSFDIFFSHAWINKPFLVYVFNELTKSGYRVWYDQNDMEYDLKKSMVDGISKSKMVLACVNSTYQNRENCMFELREANRLNKPIISLVIEENPFQWASNELKKICEFQSKMFVDISSVVSLNWENDSRVTNEMIERLKAGLRPLLDLLKQSQCNPSFSPLSKEIDIISKSTSVVKINQEDTLKVIIINI